MYEQLVLLSKNLGLPTKKILDIFFYLRDGNSVENFELLRQTGIAKNTINAVKEAFQNFFGSPSTTTKLDTSKCSDVLKKFGSNFIPDEKLLNIEVTLTGENIFSKRVEPNREYDQFTATPETVLKRASVLSHFCDIEDKRILFLGDDDFTSIPASMLASAKEVIVLDIDDRILKNINDISTSNNLNIKTIKHDLVKQLPNDLLNRFDVVFTDPPYTADGVRLFVSRAISALDKTNSSARLYLCYGNSDRAKERYLPIYRSIIDSGLMIRYVFDKFNRYTGAESIGSSSSLFVLDITPKAKALIKGDYGNPIYTND